MRHESPSSLVAIDEAIIYSCPIQQSTAQHTIIENYVQEESQLVVLTA
jgi:hypothetical protein